MPTSKKTATTIFRAVMHFPTQIAEVAPLGIGDIAETTSSSRVYLPLYGASGVYAEVEFTAPSPVGVGIRQASELVQVKVGLTQQDKPLVMEVFRITPNGVQEVYNRGLAKVKQAIRKLAKKAR